MGVLVARNPAVWLVALSLLGCGDGDGSARSGRPVLLFAAASAGNALDEIREQFTRETGVDVKASYAASSTLAQQIAYGAEADVFVSAHTKWADFLERHQNVVVKERHDLLGNRLVIVVPAGSRLNLHRPEDLLDEAVRRVALADDAAVPAGIYARQALTKLRLWDRLRGKVVAGADVRQALSYVESGAAEAGLVYATDAAVSTAVKVVAEIPADLTDPIRYPIVLLKQRGSRARAERFYRYLDSPEAAEVFRRHGFVVLGHSTADGQRPTGRP